MKALKISQQHGGRVWVAETSAGVRVSGPTLENVLGKLVRPDVPIAGLGMTTQYLGVVFDAIRDSTGPSNIGSGLAAA